MMKPDKQADITPVCSTDYILLDSILVDRKIAYPDRMMYDT